MKLSEAIMLGRHLVKPIAYVLDAEEKAGFGCALTMAAKACGKDSYFAAFDMWLWLGANGLGTQIALMFDEEVIQGRMTLEQLVDYVRSIEPAEEPEIAALPEYEIDPRDEEPWSDTQTAIEMRNSIRGR